MQGLGVYRKQDAMFETNWGTRVYFRTATDPDSIVGLTDVRFIWCDEAGLYSQYFWENVQARAAFRSAQILITTSPYALNWVYRELIRPKMKSRDARPDVEYIKARSIDNPYFPREYYERMKLTMDERRFKMMFGGDWHKMEGLVYDCFDEEKHCVTPFHLPQGTKYYAGVDWGTTNPWSLVVRAITPDGYHYQISESYKTGLTVLDMIEIAKQKLNFYKIELFFCDPANPGYIEEFNRAGIPAVGAQNDVRVGIDLHYELIKSGRYKLFRGDNKNTIDEYETYHYPNPKELNDDKDIKEQGPVKQSDHCMDANRYVTIETYEGLHHKKPQVVSLNTSDKFSSINERIAARKQPARNFEAW
jgi:PBSX family phage terminase large subunit